MTYAEIQNNDVDLTIMLYRPAHDLVIALLNPVMMAAGFLRKGAIWYRHDSETTQFIAIHLAEDKIAVRLCAVVGPSKKKAHPTIDDADISVGFGWLFRDREEWTSIRDYRRWAREDDASAAMFANAVAGKALPVLDSWRTRAGLDRFLRSDHGKHCQAFRRGSSSAGTNCEIPASSKQRPTLGQE